MKKAQTQYEVTRDHLSILEYRISQGASIMELTKFQEKRIELLDLLADLLNNEKIAIAWEDKEVKARYEDGLKTIHDSIDLVNSIQRDMNKESAFQVKLLVGICSVGWTVSALIYTYANFHK